MVTASHTSQVESSAQTYRPDWRLIDTVLLDMDGTLLDLHFDNYFWQTWLPKRYADIHGLDLDETLKKLGTHIESYRGSLQWYCLDFWSETFCVDIKSLKQEVQHKIAYRPHVKEFLTGLRQAGKDVWLVTNAHRDSVDLKLAVTGLDDYLDHIISSHDFSAPKESPEFWQKMSKAFPFDPQRSLFIDDTVSVLAAAKTFGIAQVLGIHQPDSQQPRMMDEFPAIYHFDEIMPIPKSNENQS
jgi:HAD superfamily hydrolase (TIGR01509 family)